MKIIKQYIKNNKQLIIIFFILTLFLILHNSAFCDSFFQKWYLKTENYFLNLTWEKAISDPIELSKSVGWVSIGALGSLYAFEGIWNARLLGSKFAYNYTPLGHLDDVGGNIKSWFGFRNTAGPLKYIIDTVRYEEIFPLFWARKYVFPTIFIKSNQTTVNLPSINENNRTPNSNLPVTPNRNIPEPQIIEQIVEREVEKIVHVDHFFEVPVYRHIHKYVPVVEYRDRANLLMINEKVDKLLYATTESNLLKMGFSNGYQQLKDEIIAFTSKENKSLSKTITKDLCITGIAYEDEMFFFAKYNTESGGCLFSIESFEYPLLKQLLLTGQDQNMYPYIAIAYKGNSSLFSTEKTPDFENCKIGCSNPQVEFSLFNSEGLNFLLQQNQHFKDVGNDQDFLIRDLRESINKGLFGVETRDQSTQTQEFGVNAAIFTHINSFLEIRDETSFIVASNRGNKLPFDTMISSNTTTLVQPVEIEIQTGEMSIQTDPIEENIETIDISSGVSQIIQNPAMMFAATLGILAADNLQTLETATQILLGYTSLPEYNDAFIAATHMSISELESTYNLTQQGAIRVSDLLNSAYNTMNPENNLAELSPQLTDSNSSIAKPFNWNKYLFIGASVVLVAGSAYFLWNSVKYGTPVNDWGTQYIDKIKNL